MDGQDQVAVEDIEALLGKLPGVIRTRVAVNDLGLIEEVHMLAMASRPAKALVRDVESALAAAYNIRIDHKRVSIAQIRGSEHEVEIPHLYLKSYRMDLDPSAGRMGAGVQVIPNHDPERIVDGRYEGPYMPGQQLQAVAQAAVQALNQLPGNGAAILRDVLTVELGNTPVVLVGLSLAQARQRDDVTVGVSVDAGDAHAAVAEATLDAYIRALTALRESHTA